MSSLPVDFNAAICQTVLGDAAAPGPLAITSDIIQASSALENATYDADASSTSADLATAAQWLRRAQDHAGQATDEDLASRLACAAANLEAWSTFVAGLSAGDLATYQQVTLYPYQGVLSRLLAQEAVDSQASAGLAFLGVIGALVLALGSASWIDWKQQHGGYSRGPRGKARPLVAYRY